MKMHEMAKFFDDITSIYPTFYENVSGDKLERTIKAWHGMFKYVRYEDAYTCLLRYTKENKFPPHVSDIWQSWNNDPNMTPDRSEK